jgi:hypothetical protein
MVNPRAAASASARAFRSADVVPANITSPPIRFTASTLIAGAVSGMTTTARVR